MDSLNPNLEGLREAFIAQANHRISTLSIAISLLQEGMPPRAVLERLHQEVRSLSARASTLGFNHLACNAQQLNNAIERVLRNHTPLNDLTIAHWQNQADALEIDPIAPTQISLTRSLDEVKRNPG